MFLHIIFCTLNLHIISWVLPQCKTIRPTTKAPRSQGPALSGTVQGQCISLENQIGFEHMLKLLNLMIPPLQPRPNSLNDYTQHDKRHFRRSRYQNFLRCPNMVGALLKIIFKILFEDYTLFWWFICKFLEKRGKK